MDKHINEYTELLQIADELEEKGFEEISKNIRRITNRLSKSKKELTDGLLEIKEKVKNVLNK